MSANFPFHSNTLNYIAITLFGFVYYSSQSAIASVARNMAMSEVHETKYATILSLQNMPGSLFIGAHSFYIAKFRDGCPTFTEIFISMTIVSGLFIILHFMFYNPKSIVVEA